MNILITGASGGLGLALKEKFQTAGHTVINLSRSAEGQHSYKCDVADKAQVQAVVSEIKEKYGTIDILINNAGIDEFCLFTDITDEKWHKMIDTNLSGIGFLCRGYYHHFCTYQQIS